MPIFQRQALQQALLSIEGEYREIMEQLTDLPARHGFLLDVGCASGFETIAMMCFLNADRVVGIDKDISKTDHFALQLQKDLADSIQALKYAHTSYDDHQWWSSDVPLFMKEGRFPEFFEADISTREALKVLSPVNSCAFAYCSNVLWHIHTNQGPASVMAAMKHIHELLYPGLGLWLKNQMTSTLTTFFVSLKT